MDIGKAAGVVPCAGLANRIECPAVARVRAAGLNQRGHAASDVGGDHVVRQRFKLHPFANGVHAEYQVLFAVNQGAVEIEDEQSNIGESPLLCSHRLLSL